MNPNGIGGFQKGQSGNPAGRPKIIAHIQELARAETEANIAALISIRDDTTAPAAARVAAANSLLDRGWGRPPQNLDVGISVFESLPPEKRALLDAACELLLERERATLDITPVLD